MQSLSCGYYDYTDKELVYCPEIEWLYAEGKAKFAKNALIMRFKIGNSDHKVEIPYRIVESLVVTSQPSSLTFTLWEPPRFFETPRTDLDDVVIGALAALSLRPKPTPVNNRLVELHNDSRSHTKVVGQALVYRVNVSPIDFFELSGLLIKREVLAVIRHNIRMLPTYARRCLEDGMHILNNTIREVAVITPFSVLFQIEALATNGILLPWTAQKILLKAVENIEKSSTTNTRKVSSAIRQRSWFSQLQHSMWAGFACTMTFDLVFCCQPCAFNLTNSWLEGVSNLGRGCSKIDFSDPIPWR